MALGGSLAEFGSLTLLTSLYAAIARVSRLTSALIIRKLHRLGVASSSLATEFGLLTALTKLCVRSNGSQNDVVFVSFVARSSALVGTKLNGALSPEIGKLRLLQSLCVFFF